MNSTRLRLWLMQLPLWRWLSSALKRRVPPDRGFGRFRDHVTPADGNVFADLGFPAEESAALLADADARIATRAPSAASPAATAEHPAH